MAAINNELSVIKDGLFVLAIRGKMFNSSVLQVAAQPVPAIGFLINKDQLPKIHDLATNAGLPLAEKYADVSVVAAQQDEYFRRLKAPRIAERVPGDIGRRAKLTEHGGILGEIDYLPGVWLHLDLAISYAKWIAARNAPVQKTPLLAFLEKNLPTKEAPRERLAPAKPKTVMSAFAGEVDCQTMKDLEAIDRLMMADGVSAAERTVVLRARIDLMQGV
ncbi:hypothetical protein [Pseudomonas sp. DSP3-2-2]|uniref:hypothetical protein n=1 Tax=unclassified Pseudomonas TaxID=196821 RepID=UPI003CE88FA4